MNQLSTAAIADASLRVGVGIRQGPVSLVSLIPGSYIFGPARPITHLGSVDVLLETIDDAPTGSVMVIDNGGRLDEACVGDLMLLEAREAGLSGLVVWGQHRDTAELRRIGLPIFSLGANPFGPRRVPPAGVAMRSAFIDGAAVTVDDVVVGDEDGVLFLGPEHRDEILEIAAAIQVTEGVQADRMRTGENLRTQLAFTEYRRKQADDPTMTLRKHLQERGGAIEV